ncbi:MAG: phosphoenolpyruvate--protein phosphotransferase [Nitrospinota bacterium]
MTAKTLRPRFLKGIVASTGIAIGKAHVLNKFHICIIRHSVTKENVKKEIARFDETVENTKNKMAETLNNNVKSPGDNINLVLHPHIQLLNDPALINRTRLTIEKSRVNAEWALKKTFDNLAARFEKIKDQYFRDRLNEIEIVVNRLIQNMMGTVEDNLSSLPGQVIVLAHDLTPFDTAQMNSANVLGFVTEIGGKTSHTGIIASSLNMPALVGMHKATQIAKTGDTVILDAIAGQLLVNPTEDQFKHYNRMRQQYLYFDREMESHAQEAATTKDGIVVSLKANIESSQDIEAAIGHGAEGIGLFRTEYLFAKGARFPNEYEQFAEYKKVAESIAPNDAIIRTLDFGGDKMPFITNNEPEPNPALGLRAIRHSLRNPQLFREQLRAILRASHYGRLKIMYPLISSVEELRKAVRFLDRQKRELARENVPFDENIKVGMMIETPAAALMAHQYAPYVDFFSIGTNDLIQYLLAIDRGNENVAYLYQPLHPAVIRILSIVAQAAEDHGIPVSICGQMSADPFYAYMLLGMGSISDLSMDSYSIPRLKKFIRNVSVSEAKLHMQKIMKLSRVRDIKKYMITHVSPLMAEGMISEVTVGSFGKPPNR